MVNRDFLETVDAAIHDYMHAGLTAPEVAEKHGISKATLRRHMRKRGLKLDPEETRRRKSAAGKKAAAQAGQRLKSPKCKKGCTCKRHKPPANRRYPVILGRKNCSRCKRFKHLHEYDARERDVEGIAIQWQSICKTCTRERCRISAGIRRTGKPYKARRFGAMTREQRNARKRERYREMMQDPKWAEERREYMRIYAEAKRREAGAERREKMIANRAPKSSIREDMVPLAPFQRWLEERLPVYAAAEVPTPGRPPGRPGMGGLATATGLAERTVFRFLEGRERSKTEKYDTGYREITEIPLSTVDRALMNEGSTDLWEIYPHLYDVSASDAGEIMSMDYLDSVDESEPVELVSNEELLALSY
jgi:hypothetical protein